MITMPASLPQTLQLDRLLNILSQFRAIDPEFPLQYAICLAEIAKDQGLSLTTLAERTGLALSTVSRIVGALSDYRPNGAPYGLIRMEIAKQERRRRELHVTDAGAALLRAACEPLAEGKTKAAEKKSLRNVW